MKYLLNKGFKDIRVALSNTIMNENNNVYEDFKKNFEAFNDYQILDEGWEYH